MSVENLILPERYFSKLNIMETEIAIKLVKDTFERSLAKALNLTRVSAPLFVRPETGLNDDLNGVERPVEFDVPEMNAQVQIVHSLAKWKRMALARYGFAPGTGLYTDMDAIRRDETLDNLHSVYVDQWDWERVITREERTMETLYDAVDAILGALRETQNALCDAFTSLERFLPDEAVHMTTQELEDAYPGMTAKQREDAAAREHGAVFLSQIGGRLKSGQPHDGRAPDYDDWTMNGDLLIWYPVLDRAVELSSMGVRVDAAAMKLQLEQAGCVKRAEMPFHSQVLSGALPLTMGGGIGQSRICMVLLQKAHIGEVQASIWPDSMIDTCAASGIHLL